MYLSTIQVAEKLQITPSRVKALAESGALPHLPLLDPDSKRKYYKFDEQAVYAYRRSLKHVAAATTSVQVETPAADARKAPVPSGFVPLTAAAERIGIKRQALYDAIKYHPERFDVQKIGKLMFVSEVSVERERMRRSAPAPMPATMPAAIAAAVKATMASNNGNHAEPPAPAAPHGITSILERLEIRQTELASQIHALFIKLDELLAVWR